MYISGDDPNEVPQPSGHSSVSRCSIQSNVQACRLSSQ